MEQEDTDDYITDGNAYFGYIINNYSVKNYSGQQHVKSCASIHFKYELHFT